MIKIGCCGWSFFKGGLRAYTKKFSLVEVQQTFYKLPMVKTAERWRAEAPKGFEFTAKAFQAITHLPTSPTWRRSGLELTKAQMDKYGWLKPTEENSNAWKITKKICDVLEAKICLIQCPPNFRCTRENIANMCKFLSKIDRGKLALAWEPRGDWHEHPDEIERLCDELELTHVVDLMRREPASIPANTITIMIIRQLNSSNSRRKPKFSRESTEKFT